MSEKINIPKDPRSVLSLIPEIYVDIIGRIPAGMIFVLGIVSIKSIRLYRLTDTHWFIQVLVLLVISYATGIILTAFGENVFKIYAIRTWKKSFEVIKNMSGYNPDFIPIELNNTIDSYSEKRARYHDYELLDRKIHLELKELPTKAGLLLPKTRAEAALCNNISAAFLLLFIVTCFCIHLGFQFSYFRIIFYFTAFLFSAFAGYHRSIAYTKSQFLYYATFLNQKKFSAIWPSTSKLI